MADTLQFYIGTSATLAIVSRVQRINSASINLQLNGAGSVSLTIDRTESLLQTLTPLKHCILVYRQGFLVWSGPIWTMQETYSGEHRKIDLTAVGWFEMLNHRVTRTTPGYLLQTSAITFTNATFESAISGWTGTYTTTFPNGTGGSGGTANTATRDTVNFHGGAGSLLWSENIPGPFGAIGVDTVTQIIGANALGSTPTAGKRYKLNFWARGRRSPAGVGAKLPEFRILESGSLVSSLALDLCNDLTYNTYFDGANFINPTTIANAGTVTGTFAQYSIEWVSSGISPSFNLYWVLNPSQLTSLISNWVGSTATVSSPFGYPAFNTPTGQISMGNGAWTGTFESGRVYKVSVTYTVGSGFTSVTSGGFEIRDLATGILGSVSIVGAQSGSPTTVTFNFTAGSGQIYFLVNMICNASGDELTIRDISMQENATNTDPLINIDDVTLQEYQGDGIYFNIDAGAIATALLQKTNSDSDSHITPGTSQSTQLRTRTYQQFSNIGREIKALSDIESGYDFTVDPVTRALNIYNRTNATNFPVAAAGSSAGSAGTWTYSADRTTSLRFDYGTGNDNLNSIKKTQDGSSILNRINVKGKYALGQASNIASISTYGLFEDLASLPDVVDVSTSVLPFYANAEIAFRKDPRVLYEIQTKTGGNTPRLFIDFNIGDRGTLTVGAGIVLSSGSVLTQQIRIFGVQMSVDSEGNEHLSGLQLSL